MEKTAKRTGFSVLLCICVVIVIVLGSCGGGGESGDGEFQPVLAMINGQTYAMPGDYSAAINDQGDILVVWIMWISGGQRLLYSYYDASSGTWSGEYELDTSGDFPSGPQVCSNGSDFMVVWNEYEVKAASFDGSSWSSVTTLPAPGYLGLSPHIASNGTGYAVAWYGYDEPANSIWVAMYNGSSWGSPEVVESGSSAAYFPHLASNGNGYAVVWDQSDGTYRSVWANIYSGSSWGTEALLESGSGSISGYEIASNGSGYAVTWHQWDGSDWNAHANVYESGAWQGETLLESETGQASAVHVASDGSGYAAAWNQGINVYCALYTGSWGTATLVESGTGSAGDPDIASNGSGYAVAWRQTSSGSPSIFVNFHNGVSWGTESTIESGDDSAVSPLITAGGGGYCVVWRSNDGQKWEMRTNRYNGSAWDSETDIQKNLYHNGLGSGVKLACNDAGDVLAVWEQYDGGNTYTYGRFFHNGSWQPGFPISEHGYISAVASNGTDFMIAYSEYGRLYAATYSVQNGMGASSELSDTSPYYLVMASDGAGYVVAWVGSGYDAYGCVHDGTSWGSATSIESLPGDTHQLQVATNGEGYAAIWSQYDSGTFDVYAAIYEKGSWGAETPLESSPNNAQSPQIASQGEGYAAVWEQQDSPTSIRVSFYDGASWGTDVALSDTYYAYDPYIASNGSGYGVVWWEDVTVTGVFTMYARIYDGASWDDKHVLSVGSGDARGAMIASLKGRYAVCWRQDDGTAYSVYAALHDGVDWGDAIPIEDSNNDVVYSYEPVVNLVAGNEYYAISWLQEDSDDPFVLNGWAYVGLKP
jgi:hypothetical protein